MDDYTIVVAVFLTIGYMLEIFLEKENMIGFPASTLTMEQMVNQMKVTLSIEVTYYCIVGFIKISILYLYLRFGELRPMSHPPLFFFPFPPLDEALSTKYLPKPCLGSPVTDSVCTTP